ncbi:MAG: hypothetical protein SPE12_04510, partial [Enterocloster aldenensis]|nr:hypothetical protein [Enterocloster aldenensis]
TGEAKGKMGTPGRRGATQNFYFIHNSVNKRKMALGYKSQSRFVYSLGITISNPYFCVWGFHMECVGTSDGHEPQHQVIFG